ncbi:hypothetical protein Zm00014a_029703 [Zea mays]|uniref:Uncharacterized protein n=1 Tax=Zea mays TaxID=4577 RepID=A0A317YK14_MAIZE|nr:hypothetical protein Zm00014a_029703 [Zea mays]
MIKFSLSTVFYYCAAQLRYIWESEELRRAMEPVDLIRRVKEIEQEAYGEHGMATDEDTKQTAAVDLSKRLKDLRAGNDGSSQKALEEWRKRSCVGRPSGGHGVQAHAIEKEN